MHSSHHEPKHRGPMKLTLEDNSVLQRKPLVVIRCGQKDYLALTTADKKSGNVYFYEFIEHRQDDIELLKINDKIVLNAVLDEFEKWFDEQFATQGR